MQKYRPQGVDQRVLDVGSENIVYGAIGERWLSVEGSGNKRYTHSEEPLPPTYEELMDQ